MLNPENPVHPVKLIGGKLEAQGLRLLLQVHQGAGLELDCGRLIGS